MFEPDPTKVVVPGQQAGQPAQPSQPVAPVAEMQPSGTKTDTQGLTLEQVRQALRDEMGAYQREQQSQRDKFETRINKMVKSQLDALQASGVQVTDQMKASITSATRSAIEVEDIQQPVSTPQPVAQPAKPEPAKPGQQADPNQPYYDRAGKILQQAGVSLDENDPEMAAIKGKQYSDPFEWLDDIKAAAQAKKQRLQSRPGASLPTVGGGATPTNPIANIIDPVVLLTMGLAGKKR